MVNIADNLNNYVDINFISKHTLKKPIFTNVKTNNIKIYNKGFFSVNIYLEKNMKVGKVDKVNILNDTFYFVYYNNSWRLVKMQAIVKE